MSSSRDPGENPAGTLGERILASLPGLTRFVRRRMGPELASHESASDIVQSTCRELLRGASAYEDRGEASFQNWIRSAAEHKLANRARHWRAARRASDEIALDEGQGAAEPVSPAARGPSQSAMLREEIERLQRAFKSLPEEYRHVLVRFQIEGVSQAEIAREMGRTSEAVRKLVARAMARLSAELEEGDAQPPLIERTARTPEE
jgi:RNA polymerase sigma factor (sigma-70 family)